MAQSRSNLNVKPIKLNALTLKPTGKIDRALAKKLYYQMLLTREFEDRLLKLYKQNELFGGLYTGSGNEGVCIGASMVLKKGDMMAPSHRCTGTHFVRGETLEGMMLQLMARAEGQTRGRDNAAHQGSIDRGVIGYISHLATTSTVACGTAFAQKVRKTKNVSIGFLGEGSTSLGDFHEMLNFAAVLNLPFVLIVENNQFAYSTPTNMQYRCANLSDRAVGYGMPGITIDGTDVELVYKTVFAAVERARAGQGPSLIETVTFRMQGHSAHDGAEYVPKEMIKQWEKRHPVDLYRKKLIKRGWLTAKENNALTKEIQAKIEVAVSYAKSRPYPEGATAAEGVYA